MICDNIALIKQQIKSAAEACSRNPEDIQLVAVSKRMPTERIQEARNCGQVVFGENYLQEAKEKITQLDRSVDWHFIGRLQSNKTKLAAKLFQVVETVDRLKVARLLDKYAAELNKQLTVFIQVNIGEEEQKSGIAPDKVFELLAQTSKLQHLRVRGLMMIPPLSKTPEERRPWFKELKQLSVMLAQKEFFYDNESVELSMGMSGDFKIAIEEGATLIRVGTAIFGPRPY